MTSRRLADDEREVSSLQPKVLAALCALPGVRVWKNPRGKHPAPWGAWIEYGGPPGAADLIGCARGLFLAVETKSRTGRQREEQRVFQRVVQEVCGGIYIMPRTAEQSVSMLVDELSKRNK